MEKENRKYKDSMFVDLFYEDENAEENDISLYNALHEEPLPEGTKIEKIRVEDILYMNFKNDISFGVGGKVLVFGEHQSTINENMPLRSLLYAGRAYEQIVPIRDRYKTGLVKIPASEFYTFYNGTESIEKELELKLSDAFIMKQKKPMLELSVKVININPDEHHEILDKCKVLKEYGLFIDLVRKNREQNIAEPIKEAIREALSKGILSDYLKRKGSEVVNFLTAEYDYNMDIEVKCEEAEQRGEIRGEARGEEKFAALNKKLLEEKRYDELEKIITDEEYRSRLYKEYKIV